MPHTESHDETGAASLKAQAPTRFSALRPIQNPSPRTAVQPIKRSTNARKMISNTLTDFKFTGNPSTNAAKLASLAHGGPLVVANDHRLSAMLPDAFADAAGGAKTVCMADFEPMILDAMLLDVDVAKGGVHFVVQPARYKQLLVDMDSTGEKETKIKPSKKE